MKAKRAERGFTLIELMLVVAIIGILAAVAMPAYQDYVVRSRTIEAFNLAGPAQRAVVDYYERWGRFPRDNQMAGIEPFAAWAGRTVQGLRIVDGAVEVVVKMSPGGRGHTLHLIPVVNTKYPTGVLSWSCNSTKVPPGFEARGKVDEGAIAADKYLPAVCRR